MLEQMGTVTSLSIYPVKAMRGIALDSTKVTWLGLEFDRNYLVVDEEGVFITQRNLPALATIQTSIRANELHLTSSNGSEIRLESITTNSCRKVTIWKDEVEALDMGDEISDWLSLEFKAKFRLVKLDSKTRRQIDPNFGRIGEFVSFADGFPILVTNQSSLDDLNSRMESPLPMNRFRPNIVVEGFEAWDEDNWKEVQIGSLTLRSVKPCARCRVTTQDQATGIRHGEEPLATLATFRNIGKKVIFGQNLIPNAEGLIRVGDPIQVVAR